MISTNYQVLDEMINDLKQELNQINKQIDFNLKKIEKAGGFEKRQLSQEKEDSILYEKENRELYLTKEKLILKIEQLENLLLEKREQGCITLNIQEADRQRIARDLHDTSLQNLAHLVHKIELSSMYIEKDPLRAKLELSVVSKNLKNIIEEVRNTIFNLRPMTFDDLGMKAALERLVSFVNENKTYEMDVEIDDVSCENNLILVSLYRVIQECFTNIIKHAKATKIYFHCHLINGEYCVMIKDNGIGFIEEVDEDKDTKHFGLLLMKERINLVGGKIVINSSTEGTEIKLSVPIDKC